MARFFSGIVAGGLWLVLMGSAGHAAGELRHTDSYTGINRTAGIQVAANKTYKLVNIFPFPVEIRVHGNGPTFPQVHSMPAGPAPVPIPYPNTSMKIQVKKPVGGWSPPMTIKWKAGNIALPSF
jgi:hypothetical protein